MNISMIGTGYVGLVSGACLSEFGHVITCMDVDETKIHNLEKGFMPIYEPGLDVIVKKNMADGRLRFTTNIKTAVDSSDVIFIAVGTPPLEDGSADMRYVLEAVKQIASIMDGYKVIVNKSTVPVGTARLTKELVGETLNARGVSFGFDVVSNPEFLREGAAVNDFMHPDRIVIGCDSGKARSYMEEIYRVLHINNHPFVFSNPETAELIKYASNAYLAAKITFVNELSELCEKVGANIQQVSSAMGLDKRIGKFFLHAGAGYGGSCFPKDTRALLHIAAEHQVNLSIIDRVVSANERQKLRMVDKIAAKMGDLSGKTFAVLGLAFKPETDDIREAPALVIIRELIRRGAVVRAYDPVAMENCKKFGFSEMLVEYCKNEYDAINGSDAIVIVTEWNVFRSLDFERVAKLVRGRYFFDFRNIYDRTLLEGHGFEYEGVGR